MEECFKELMVIKNAPLSTLPTLSSLLNALLTITKIDPGVLITKVSSRTKQHYNIFDPDVFLKIVLYAESLEVQQFEMFADLVRTELRTIKSPIMQHFPDFFVSCKKGKSFLFAGYYDLLQIKKTRTEIDQDNLSIFITEHPQYYQTESLRQFMQFVVEQLNS